MLDSSKYTLIDGASENEELQANLRHVQKEIEKYNKTHPPKILLPTLKPPPGAVPVTDVDEDGKLVIIGYKVEE